MVLYLYIFFGGFEVTAQVACQPRATRKSSLYMHAKKTKNSLISTSDSVDLVISQTQTFLYSCISFLRVSSYIDSRFVHFRGVALNVP